MTDIDSNINNEIKDNILDFYYKHEKECNRLYQYATDKTKLKIYKEVTDSNCLNELFLKTDLIILTANVFEKNILHKNAIRGKKGKIIHTIINSCINPKRPLNINIYFFDINNYHILHMDANQTGSYSMGGSSDLIRYILKNEYCYPSAIISYGICFGNNYEKQQLGDVIIANKLYPYFMSAKVKEKYIFVKDSNIFSIDTQLDAKIRFLIDKGELSEKNRIFYGNMVTGEAVISNDIMKEIFIKAATNQPILGGEMEGYGLFKECQGFECSIPCLLVKSICDWGAYKNIDDENIGIDNLKDKIQAYAANQAYKVLTILLRDDANIFIHSIYEQIKTMVDTLSSVKGEVFHELMLDKMIKNEVKFFKKCNNNELLLEMIINTLAKDGILVKINGGVYRFMERREL